jgi:hypothetical protein
MLTSPSERAPSPRIFVSSTARDLRAHREAVADVIHRLGYIPVGMETFGALTAESLAECRRLASEADALIVIVAQRYGWVPTREEGGDGEKSITWHEVSAAEAAGKDVLRYLHENSGTAPQIDDDPRLERFREELRRYPCETFSTPDDLAKKVAVDLPKWWKKHSRNFAAVLARAARDRSATRAGSFGLGSDDVALLRRLVSDRTALSLEELDGIVSGSHTRAAKLERDENVRGAATQLARLERELADAQSDERKMQQTVDALRAERRPEAPKRPRAPQPPPTTGWNEEASKESHWRIREQHRAAENEYTLNLAKYDVAVAEFEQRQASIPQHGLVLEASKQRVAIASSNINDFKDEATADQRRLEREIQVARDRDIAAFLTRLRFRAKELVGNPETVSQGFLLLAATTVSTPILRNFLSGDLSAASQFQQTSDKISESLDELIRSRSHFHQVGEDFLTLVALLLDARSKATALLNEVQMGLTAAPSDEFHAFCSRSAELLERSIPRLERYDSLVDLNQIGEAKKKQNRQMSEVGEARKAIEAFLAASGALERRAEDVQTSTGATAARIRELAVAQQAVLEECGLVARFTRRIASMSHVTKDQSDFAKALLHEAAQRTGESLESFLGSCESTQFGFLDAERVRGDHSSRAVLRAASDLRQRISDLDVASSEFAAAIKDIADLPRRNAEAYMKRFKLFAWLSFVPVVNVVCAFMARRLLTRYSSALKSRDALYQRLAYLSLVSAWAATIISAGAAAASGFALAYAGASHTEVLWGTAAIFLSFFVTSIAWGLNTWAIARLRNTTRSEPGRPDGKHVV